MLLGSKLATPRGFFSGERSLPIGLLVLKNINCLCLQMLLLKNKQNNLLINAVSFFISLLSVGALQNLDFRVAKCL